jgi:hypothetical protein
MNRTPFRLALAASLSLAALPALAMEPLWPELERPRPARVLAAQPDFTPSAISGDPTWPVVATTMPAIRYASRTDLAPVFEPAVDAHQQAMAASRPAPRRATEPQVAAK